MTIIKSWLLSFWYLFCYTKKSELKYVWVIILILRSKNRFINKALNKFEKKKEKSILFYKKLYKINSKITTCYSHHFVTQTHII